MRTLIKRKMQTCKKSNCDCVNYSEVKITVISFRILKLPFLLNFLHQIYKISTAA